MFNVMDMYWGKFWSLQLNNDVCNLHCILKSHSAVASQQIIGNEGLGYFQRDLVSEPLKLSVRRLLRAEQMNVV